MSCVQLSNCCCSRVFFLNCWVVYYISGLMHSVVVSILSECWCTVLVLLQRYYIPTARELQRLESVTRSPIYSKFSEALAGEHTHGGPVAC